jgi:hypothetical protein
MLTILGGEAPPAIQVATATPGEVVPAVDSQAPPTFPRPDIAEGFVGHNHTNPPPAAEPVLAETPAQIAPTYEPPFPWRSPAAQVPKGYAAHDHANPPRHPAVVTFSPQDLPHPFRFEVTGVPLGFAGHVEDNPPVSAEPVVPETPAQTTAATALPFPYHFDWRRLPASIISLIYEAPQSAYPLPPVTVAEIRPKDLPFPWRFTVPPLHSTVHLTGETQLGAITVPTISGERSTSAKVLVNVTAGSVYRLRVQRTDGTEDLRTIENATAVTIRKVR